MGNKKLIKIIIERSAEGFSAYAPDIKGIYGMGDTPKEAQESILESINMIWRVFLTITARYLQMQLWRELPE